jgi:hypothetical protein
MILVVETMGAPGTFEFRRAELAAMRRAERAGRGDVVAGRGGSGGSGADTAAAVSDDDVVDDLLASVAPGGAIAE